MLKRLWAWMGRHRWRIFWAVLLSPIVYSALLLSLILISNWYYDRLPFSDFAVRMFAKPGEDTLMFRYRLGDRSLYIRSDMAQTARYSREKIEYCNPLWGECRVFPLKIIIYVSGDLKETCVGGNAHCRELNKNYINEIEFWIVNNSYSNVDLFHKSCFEGYYISSYGNFKGYYIEKASGKQERLCHLIQPGGVLETLLTAMETGNYDQFPHIRRTDSAD